MEHPYEPLRKSRRLGVKGLQGRWLEWREDQTWAKEVPRAIWRGGVLRAQQPGLTYVVRIRELGTEQWSFGFETPVPGCTFVDLKPDTEYELQIRTKKATGKEPLRISQRGPTRRARAATSSPSRHLDDATANCPGSVQMNMYRCLPKRPFRR